MKKNNISKLIAFLIICFSAVVILPFCISNSQNGMGESSICEPIQEEGEQCLYRISKNSNISIFESSGSQYLCETGTTKKYKRSATFTIDSNPDCYETISFIPNSSLIKTTGYEIIRPDSTGIFTGNFKLYDPNNTELGTGYIYIISRVGTHRSPLPTSSQCESCNPYRHSEGFLCGELEYGQQTGVIFCQIAVSHWYSVSSTMNPVATFEGILAK